jgi:anti-sigma B factor antagonist
MVVIDSNDYNLIDESLSSVDATTFTIVNEPEGRESVLEIDGEVGVTTAARFRGALRYAIICRPERLTVDMRRVSMIDSTGLRALVAANGRCIHLGISLRLMAPHAGAMRVLEATGLDRVLTVVPESQFSFSVAV